MKLVIGYGGGTGYYPYTQKPVDYQPYRPIYLFRGPPPDAGFSYGLFEDEESQEQYYAEMGLDPFSPFSGKPSKLLKEVGFDEMHKNLQEHLKEEHLESIECGECGGKYAQNIRSQRRGRNNLYCHRCGSKLKGLE